MKIRSEYLFAALRFFEDENLANRTYWYESGFLPAEGEEVLAPVGAHNGLERARVERVLKTDAAHAPYDPALVKRIEARYGARRLAAGECVCFELGGLKYDEKRYTRFRRALFCAGEPNGEEREILREYGVQEFLYGDENALLRAAAACGNCALLCGEHARGAAETLLKYVRGESAPQELQTLVRELR